jgi:disulfide bond formation protein DsbB
VKRSHARIGLACFIVGCLLVLLIDASLARIIGVPMIFAGIFFGIYAIASPDFLKADHHESSGT